MINADLLGLAHPVSSLSTLPGNPRRGDVEAVAASLKRFGQRKPIVARASDRVVIAGNHTLQAALLLGWEDIAVSFVHEDEQESLAFALADNRTAELGSYDDAALLEVIQSVGDFDASLLIDAGWDAAAVSDLINSIKPDVPNPVDEDEDEIPSPSAVAVCRPGDIWILGDHRVMCGDSRNAEDVSALLAGSAINVAFTSPPYAAQRNYDSSSGFKPVATDDYVEWFAPISERVKEHLASDGSWFINIKENANEGQRVLYVKDLVLKHVRSWEWLFVDELVWVHNGLPGTWDNRCKNQFEPVFHFSKDRYIKFHPDRVSTDSVDAFKYSGGFEEASTGNPISWSGSDVDRMQGKALPGNVLSIGKNREAVRHEAMFPIALPEWFIQVYSDRKDAVYDPFMGSGSTLLAAHRHDRTAFGMEISAGYVDVICARFQKHTGIIPVLESTGEQHDFTGGSDAESS